jgi:hypothetical protein
MVDKNLQKGNNPLGATFFNKEIMWGLEEFSHVEPSLKCVMPVVKDAIGQPVVRQWEQAATDTVNHFFRKWVMGQGNRVWEWVMEKAVNGLPELILGKDTWQKVKGFAIKAILNLERGVSHEIIAIIKHIDTMKPGRLRMQAAEQVKLLLKGTFKPKQLLTVGFEIVQKMISDLISKMVLMVLPSVWDVILNLISTILLPAITLGINEATASGSCATGWISTVIMNIVQGVWEFIQTEGRAAFMYITPMIVNQVVSFMFNTMFNLVVKPGAALLAPLGNWVNSILSKVKSAIKEISSLIPPGIMRVMKKIMSNIFKMFMKNLSPKIGESTKMAVQFARAFVQREKDALVRWEKSTRAPTPPPTTLNIPFKKLMPQAPPSTTSPTAPTPPPTPAPTSVPTPDIDWTDQVPESDKVRDEKEDDVDDQAPVDPATDVIPPNQVPSQQDKHEKRQAMKKDPVYAHLNHWLKGHKEINQKQKMPASVRAFEADL